MKLLLYGFESFGQHVTNISQEIVDRVAVRPDVVKLVLPVRFNDASILDFVRRIKPDYILGLGQYPEGNNIRIEKQAKNEWASKSKPSRLLIKDGPKTVVVTLGLKSDTNSVVSNDAGRYFCNYSMYLLLTNPETKNIPFAFVHIPKSFNLELAVGFVEAKIDEILA